MQAVALPAFFLFFFIAFCYIDFCSSSPMQICDASLVLPQLKPERQKVSTAVFQTLRIYLSHLLQFLSHLITSLLLVHSSIIPTLQAIVSFTFLKPKIPFPNFMNQGTIVCTSSLTNELEHPLIYVFPYFHLDIINISSKTITTWSAFFWSIGHE